MDGQPRLDPETDFLANAAGQRLCALLEDAGHQAFFVGGCVRNAVMGLPASDVDMATDARPDAVMGLAKSAGVRALPTGIDHGTVTIVMDGTPFEITTFRKDVATDGRRAVVAFSNTINEDAYRRDFTMNALYADARGQIHDPVGGYADALARRVRFIDDATARIREDYLRTLRFFRFSAWYADPTLGWDPEALAAIAATLDGLATLSAERVGAEMLKLLAAPDPTPSVAVMAQVGVLGALLPGADPQFLGPLVHHEEHSGSEHDPYARLAALGGQDVGERLRLSRKGQKHLAAIQALAGSTRGPKAMGFLEGASVAEGALLLRAAMLGTALPPNWKSDAAFGENQVFPVTAADLPEFEGPALGQRLKALKQVWLASDLSKTKSELMTS